MATQFCSNSSALMIYYPLSRQKQGTIAHQMKPLMSDMGNRWGSKTRISISTRCSSNPIPTIRTCKNCKTQFDSSLNHARACRYHTAHFGGETRRKFESVHTGGTLNTPESGKISQYWHCCGSEDPFDPGCTAAPHYSYDD